MEEKGGMASVTSSPHGQEIIQKEIKSLRDDNELCFMSAGELKSSLGKE